MINEETEKIAICPVCLKNLITDLYFFSDDYLYHKKCFRPDKIFHIMYL